MIIDDHDDLATALQRVFTKDGHEVSVLDNRADALATTNVQDYDLVITDLDVAHVPAEPALNGNGSGARCVPQDIEEPASGRHTKAFKVCASNFRRDGFDEEELKSFVETVLNYKNCCVDTAEGIRDLHENIEFELPSSISIMHSILDYLMKRVEKLGVVKAEQSNLFVALDEAFVNAVKHGNKFDAAKLVRIVADVSKKEARFTIEDQGEGFDVNSIPDPLDPQNLFKTSGRGVLFIYNIMDEVEYNERGNRLTMVKRCEHEPVS